MINIILFPFFFDRVIPPFAEYTDISLPVFRRELFSGADHFKQRASILFYFMFFCRIDPVGTHPRRNSHRTLRNSGDH